ncbi:MULTISPECIES: hypothetical protein [unclassified Streptomyces]|uniref:hypothetical protein n=1 Tax=unclassified Streptomyces TaxID=2593676 RepID=UPI002365226C|nr:MULTISPECIES: hypothetical protein [unclassified Streptomyces]MDF3141515.1 hypothetical protein [Streptomyces sp. T21Q-yed]WDF37342.1 hypothetical protein PBV52_11350 [Streptomyces sp. T12]
MGIRTLHRRTAPAPAQANAEKAPATAHPPVPAVATDASTARIPADLMSTLRHKATTTRRRLAHRAPGWAELTRSYLALALTLLPRSHPQGTVTVFVAPAGTLTEPPDGSTPYRPHPYPHCQGPGPGPAPGATP